MSFERGIIYEDEDGPALSPESFDDPKYMTWHDRIQNYCERNNLTDADNEFFSSLLTEALLAAPSPSDSAIQQAAKDDQ